MPIEIQCPECGKSHRRASVPSGRDIQCPKCGVFFSSEEAVHRIPDEDDEPPRRKPKPKVVLEELDDDELPQPASVRRSRDDDEFGDRPRRSRKKKAAKSSAPLLAMIGGGLAFLLVVVGGLVWAFPGSKAKPPVAVNSTESITTPTASSISAATPSPLVVNTLAKTSTTTPTMAPKPPTAFPTPATPSMPSAVPKGPVPPTAPSEASKPTPPVAAPLTAAFDPALLEKSRKATVRILLEAGKHSGSGSGFIVRSNLDAAYIVTNFHVIAVPEEEPEPANNQGGAPGPRGGPAGPRGFPGPAGPGGPRGPGMIPRPPTPFSHNRSFGPPGFGNPIFGGGGQEEKPKIKPKVTVVLHSGTPNESKHVAEIVAVDPEADLATLRIGGARNVPDPLDTTQETPVQETMPVAILGFPGGVQEIQTHEGKVSQVRRDDKGMLEDLQVNGSLIPGNSGGPIVDVQGRLVGIAVSTVMGKNVGFAIPASRLDHMFKGSLHAGLVFQIKPYGGSFNVNGEIWYVDRKQAVRKRDNIKVTISAAPEGASATNYTVLASINDPMHKINVIKALFSKTPGPATPGPDGWAALTNPQAVNLNLRNDIAIGSFTLPKDAVADETFYFQFTFVNAEGKTIYSQPHPVRLTFPKNLKAMTIRVKTPLEDSVRRYVDDQITKALGKRGIRSMRTATGVTLLLDNVEDPKKLIEEINFGKVVSVEGGTVNVEVGAVTLPTPTNEELTKAIQDIKSGEEGRVQGAVDRLGKTYVIVPARREEVAKSLEPLLTDKNVFIRRPATSAPQQWSGPENVPALIKALETREALSTETVCTILKKYKDPSLREALGGPAGGWLCRARCGGSTAGDRRSRGGEGGDSVPHQR